MNRDEAEENLRVIRSLMEKATVYRAISAPTALVGGLASVAAATSLYFYYRVPAHWEETNSLLVHAIVWLGVLILTGLANTWFIWRDAARRAETFVSAGMKKALAAFLPPLLCGAVFTLFAQKLGIQYVPSVWMTFYGLGLLATSHFAPRSIPRLGWVFIVGATATAWQVDEFWFLAYDDLSKANLLMFFTFGGFHLIYAVLTWRHLREPIS